MSGSQKPIKKVTSKVNEMLVIIIGIYILLVSMQMWLLFGTINKALDQENLAFAAYSALGSVILFLAVLYFLRYIPVISTGTAIKEDEKNGN